MNEHAYQQHRRPRFSGFILSMSGLLAATPLLNAEGTATQEAYRLPTITIVGTEPQSESSSVTVLSGSRIQNGQITSTRDLTGVAPNVTVFDANGDRSPKFTVRGLRENNFSAGQPVIGLYVDDVPHNDLSSRGLPLYDVDTVEYLRGPQGTLYGAGSPGGLLIINTRQPGNTWRGQAGASYGNYDSQNYQAGVSGPVVQDHLYLGISGFYARRDGFVHNTTLDTHPDDRETVAGRAHLRWTPSDAWDISLTATAERFDDGFIPTFVRGSDSGPFSVSRDFDGYVDTESLSQALRIGYKHGEFEVLSVTAHRDWEQDLLQDFDFSSSPGVLGFTRPDLSQWSQELRVQSPADAGDLQWLGGIYFEDRNLKSDSGATFPSGIPLPFPPFFIPGPLTDRTTATFDDQSYAAFGQTTITLREHLDLTGGVRLQYDDKSMRRRRVDGTGFSGPDPLVVNIDDEWCAVLPKAGVAYRPATGHSIFLNAAAGHQSGGFNASNNDPSQARYDDSRSWNFELGWRAAWLDGKLSTRATLFYSHFEDYQVFRFNQSNPTLAYVVNAERAHAFGGELELAATPVDNLELSLALGATEAKFDDFNDPVNSANFDDKDINFVPRFNATLAAQYRFPGNFFARVEMQGVGEYYYDEANTAKQGSFALLNARVGYEWKAVQVYLFGNNLLDKEYFNNGLDFRSAPTPGLLVLQPGDPVTFGAAVTARF